jgi:hypothetical protein
VNGTPAGSPDLTFVIDGITLNPDASIGWMAGTTAGGPGAILSIVITETFCVGALTTTSCPERGYGHDRRHGECDRHGHRRRRRNVHLSMQHRQQRSDQLRIVNL